MENFGCRTARADSEAISSRLRSDGLTMQALAEADVVVLNTCSVTAEADKEARAFLRHAQRVNPSARVVVTGCYAQRVPHEVARLEGVSAVVGNSHKALVPRIVQELAIRTADLQAGASLDQSTHLINPATLFSGPNRAPILADERFAHSFLEDSLPAPGLGSGTQTRPNFKIQEGCGNRCAFCVIPTTRGSSRSLAPEKVLRQIHSFVEGGGNELVISGINLGRWGRDLPAEGRPPALASLVRTIVIETALPRLRLSSIEPMDWTPELIRLMAEFGGGRIARHAHLPLQSGSDAVLRRMHRRYRPWHYTEKVHALVNAVGEELALGADVMVGFPGETDAEFGETRDLIASLPFTYLHLFPFSARPGTRAWELHRERPVAPQAIRERMAVLAALAADKARSFRRRLIGRPLPAITLNASPSVVSRGGTSVLTDNFLPVELPDLLPANRLLHVVITSFADGEALQGETHLRDSNVAVAS